MPPSVPSRRVEALDKFQERAQNDLVTKAAQSVMARDLVDFDAHSMREPDSSKFQAEDEVDILSTQNRESQNIVRELSDVREQLLSVGCDAVSEGTLVTLEGVDDTALKATYLIVPNGSGNKVVLDDGTRVVCMSPQAPLAKGLMGMEVGDDLDTLAIYANREKIMAIASIE